MCCLLSGMSPSFDLPPSHSPIVPTLFLAAFSTFLCTLPYAATATFPSSPSFPANPPSFYKARWVGKVRGGGDDEGSITPGLSPQDFTLLKEKDLYRGKWCVSTYKLLNTDAGSAILKGGYQDNVASRGSVNKQTKCHYLPSAYHFHSQAFPPPARCPIPGWTSGYFRRDGSTGKQRPGFHLE